VGSAQRATFCVRGVAGEPDAPRARGVVIRVTVSGEGEFRRHETHSDGAPSRPLRRWAMCLRGGVATTHPESGCHIPSSRLA
jgi:hypothetical protein